MSNTNNRGKGGAPIPSARPSIHSHNFSDQSRSMVRYGVDEKNTSNQDRDEVDNVFSKPARTPEYTCRRNSLSSPNRSNEIYKSDSELIYAKSVPANLPSHSYYRNEYGYGARDLQNISSDAANGSNDTLYTSDSNNKSSSLERSRSIENVKSKLNSSRVPTRDTSNTPQSTSYGLYIILPIIFIVIGVLYYNNGITSFHKVDIVNYDVIKFNNDINNLANKYNINKDAVLLIETGISMIQKREDAGSFIFLYNSKSKRFNYAVFNNVIEEVVTAASKYLRNESMPVKITIAHGSNLGVETHSELLNKYKDEVEKSGVILIKELTEVPSDLAMAFHYYCDEYNPLIKKSAIFFSLNISGCINVDVSRSQHTAIEKCLTEKWTSVPKENVSPLLTRVVSTIIDLTDV